MYFQPIKHDDTGRDFYTMYKRETMEYDTEYMQKYNEDLNTTLIFVSLHISHHYITLNIFAGRSVLRSQLRLRHRRPVEPPARLRRTVRSLPPSNPLQPQPVCRSRRRPYGSSSMEWSPCRGYRRYGSPVRKPSNVVVGRIRRNAGQAMVESVPPTRRRIDGRTVWRPSARIRWPREMALPHVHRKPPHHAPDRPSPPRLWFVTVHVVGRHVCCTRCHLLHRPRRPLLHWDRGRGGVVVRVSIPNASIDGSPISQRERDDPEIVREAIFA